MFFLHRMKSVLLALVSSLFLWSCSLFEADVTGSVTFCIDAVTEGIITEAASTQPAARSLTAEDIPIEDTSDGLYFDISLKGEIKVQKTLSVVEGASVTFENIPVGTELWAEGTAYRTEKTESGTEQRVVFYSGKSENIKVRAGKNTLSLLMKKSGSLFVNVTVVIHSDDNGISLSQTTDGTKIIFTAGESSEAYIWYVDGVKQSDTGAIFEFETEGMTTGVYEIEVVNGEKSAFATVEIE